MKNFFIISKVQCTTARALLEWNQADLAEKSGISNATTANFESGRTNIAANSVVAIMNAFHEAGIRFEENENEIVIRLIKKL